MSEGSPKPLNQRPAITVPSDADLAKGLPYSNAYIANEFPDAEILTKAAQDKLLQKAGLPITPILQKLSPDDRRAGYQDGRTIESQSGQTYIRVEANLFGDIARGVIAHELGHAYYGDMSKANLEALAKLSKKDFNKASQHMEFRADHFAEAVLCEGRNLKARLENQQSDLIEAANEQGLSSKAIEKLSPEHPSIKSRIESLTKDIHAAESSGLCPAPTPNTKNNGRVR